MSELFNLEIVNPEKSFLSADDVKEVVVPAYEGEMGILKNHISIISFLKPGIMKIYLNNAEEKFYIEDGILISIKSLNEHFSKLFPLLDLIISKPILSETEFKKVKKSSIDHIKKDKENPFNICFENWRRIVYLNHPYAFNTIGNANDVSKITYEDV